MDTGRKSDRSPLWHCLTLRQLFQMLGLLKEYFTYSGAHRKTLDNNDLNQVMRPAVLVKTRIWLGVQSRMLKKTGLAHSHLRIFEPITRQNRSRERHGTNVLKPILFAPDVIAIPLKSIFLSSVIWLSVWSECNLSCKKHVLNPTKRFPPHVPHWP